MKQQYKKHSSAGKNGGRRAILAVGVIAALVLLFFLSFWITSMVLKVNQQPVLPQQEGVVASPTPKPTYEELEKMVIEKEAEVKKLEKELAQYRKSGSSATAKPAATNTPKATQAPTAAPTKAPTPAPTPAPTAAPIQTAAPKSTPAPTQTPVTPVSPAAEAPAAE